jgi:hypothetical protein
MAMTRDGFLKRLRAGKAVNCSFCKGEVIGLIASRFYDGKYVLTWEECRPEDIHDDAAYLRDEVRDFATPEAVLAFVEENGYPPSQFHP